MRRFSVRLGLIGLVALAARVAYVAIVARHQPLGADALWYSLVSGPLSSGHGLLEPTAYFSSGRELATAGHAPLFPSFLAVVTRVADGNADTFRYASVIWGAAAAVLTGCIARRFVRTSDALAAAAIAAVFPSLVAVDGALMTETLEIPLLLGAVLVSVAAVARPSWWRFALGGLLFGLAGLARPDALVFAAFVLGATVIAAPGPARARLAYGASAILVVAAVVAPWVVRNEIRLHEITLETTSAAGTIAGANCATTYHGRLIGAWDFACTNADRRAALSETRWTHETQHLGLHYAKTHLARTPLVVAARELRVFGLWVHPRDQIRMEAVEGRSYRWQLFAWVCWLPVLVAGGAGLVVLGRRTRLAWPLLATVPALLVLAAASYGNQRFRLAVEPVFIVGAVVSARSIARSWQGFRASRATPIPE